MHKRFIALITIVAAALFTLPTLAQPQLISMHPFNGNANDESGNGHDGTVDGAVLTTDRFGSPNSAYYFNGAEKIVVPSSPFFGPDSGIIIDLWIRPTAYPDLTGTGWEYHKMILGTTTDANGFQMALMADSSACFGIAPYPWVNTYSVTKIPLNLWTHLRGTFQQSTGTIRIFVDGVLEGEVISPTRDLGPTGVWIGRNPMSTFPDRPHAFVGDIDDIRIFAWGENQAFYNDGNTVALYHMDESSGTLVSDASGSGNDGTAYDASICDGWIGLGRSVPKNTTNLGVVVPNSASISGLSTGPFTVEGYLYLEAYDESGLQIIHNDQLELGMGSYGSSGYLQLQLQPGPMPHPVIQSPQQLPLNEWVHVAATWDGTWADLFVNGIAVRSEMVDWTLGVATTDLRIGDHYGADTSPSGNTVKIDEVRLSSTLRYQAPDRLRIGSPVCSIEPPYKIDYIPVFLHNRDTVKAIDLPAEYDWNIDPIDISFEGTRLEGRATLIGQVDATNKRIRIGWASFSATDVLEPATLTTADIPIAKIMMPDCRREYFSALDTTTIQLPVNPVSLELSDKFGQRYVPEFVSDSTWIRSYTPGDANWDDLTTISDPVYLINYIFGGGPAPICLLAADCTCDGIVTISDAVYLINYIFGGGPVPGTNCLCTSMPLAKADPVGAASVAVGARADALDVELTTTSQMQALQLNFVSTGQLENISITATDPRFQVFSGWVEGEYRVGLIDLTGKTTLLAGTHDLLTISYEGEGELVLNSAIVVDSDAQEMNVTISSSKTSSILPTEFSLSQNRPNPFNPTTEISFSLPKPAEVNLTIYNILGEKVVTLTEGTRTAGVHSVTWDGRDSRGNTVASGVYFYRLDAGSFTATKKMLMMK